MSDSIQDCFVLKDKIQDLSNRGSISLLDETVKAPEQQVSITKNTLDRNKFQTLDDEETPDTREECTASKS